VFEARLMVLLRKKITATKFKEMKTGCNVAQTSKEELSPS
jgi:hypothetical protein